MPDQAEEEELLTSPGGLKGRVGRAALCIVGEWRTFGMPAVHEGVELARHVWQADVFMFYHTRYDAVAMAHKHRQNAEACAEETHLLQNYTHVEHLPYDGCKSKATVQHRQINRCFRHVMEHERRNGVRYDYFIRSRPDYIVWNPEPMQPKLTQMLAVRPKPDMLFTIPRAKLHEWLTGINEKECLNVVRRPEHCCLEYTHGMLKPTNHRMWRQQVPLLVVGSTWNMPASSVHAFHRACCTATSRVVPEAPQSATGRLRYRGAPEGWIFIRWPRWVRL